MGIQVSNYSPVHPLVQKKNSPAQSPIKSQYSTANNKQVISYKGSQALMAALSPSFKGVQKDYEVQAKQIFVPSLFDVKENFELEKDNKLNEGGLLVEKKSVEGKKQVAVKDASENEIFVGVKDTAGAKAPKAAYKQGKFKPTVEIVDKELGIKVRMLAGSRIEGNDFRYVMPGSVQIPGKKSSNISFSGHGQVFISTYNLEPRTRDSVKEFRKDKLYNQAIKGDYANIVEKNEPTVVIPAGGFGERFFNLTEEAENKPSYILPTKRSYRVMGNALGLASSAGVLNGDHDVVKYLSQAHNLKGRGALYVNKYSADAGAIAEGIGAKKAIPVNKDMMILNADIFTNADITRAYHALKTLPHAAVVIPYYPVNPERAKSFGLLGIKQDDEGNLKIDTFVEKPKYTSVEPQADKFKSEEDYEKAMDDYRMAQMAKLPGDDGVFLANPGIYLLSPEAVEIVGKHSGESVGLGKDLMPEIVNLCREGKLKDKDGNPMKVYTVPLESKGGKPAFWDDIGSAEAYLKLIKDVAHETEQKGTSSDNKYYGVPKFVLEDFKKNTDLETGIVCDSPKSKAALEKFKEKYGINNIEGNIYVTDEQPVAA